MAEPQEVLAIGQYLTFRLNRESYGIDVLKVREILDRTDITRIPQAPDYMLGVINLRGNVVPVIDLRKRFGMPVSELTTDSCIVVIEVNLGGVLVVVGILGDMVEEVVNLADDEIEPAPRIGHRLRVEFIAGMGKVAEDDFVILLDIDRIFTSDELLQVCEASYSES